MKLLLSTQLLWGLTAVQNAIADDEGSGQMVKMCLFYPSPSGHARTDPILSQSCPSDHVHTFYGPQNIHPDTTYQDLLDTKPSFSTTPWIENQSLYWHPSIYAQNKKTGVYTRVSQLESSPYYRWDQSAPTLTEAFPPKFRMIAYSDQENAGAGGETGNNLFMECCTEDESRCTNSYGTTFPSKKCGFLGIAMSMPTCWNGDLGIDNDHKSHMAYTLDGTVAGECPSTHTKRLPQVQLFLRITNYNGKKNRYTFADEADNFHLDFMNGWEEGKLQEIIDNCSVIGDGSEGYNPPCNCAEEFLTPNDSPSGALCDEDVKAFILNEETNVVNTLPRGNKDNCNSGEIIPKWDSVDPPFTCGTGGGGGGGDGNDDEECPPDPNKKKFYTGDTKVNKKGKTVPVKKKCSWLQKKSKKRQEELCEMTDGWNEKLLPAREVCTGTCNICDGI